MEDVKSNGSSQETMGSVPKEEKGSTMEIICGKDRFWAGSEREIELWIMREEIHQRKVAEGERG